MPCRYWRTTQRRSCASNATTAAAPGWRTKSMSYSRPFEYFSRSEETSITRPLNFSSLAVVVGFSMRVLVNAQASKPVIIPEKSLKAASCDLVPRAEHQKCAILKARST